jgi:DNA recombination protein RmuC
MELNTTVFLILFGITLLVIFFLWAWQRRAQSSSSLFETMESLRKELSSSAERHRQETQERLDRLHDRLHQGLNTSHESIQKQFSDTAKIIREVTEKLTTLDQTNKQVLDFSAQLKQLQSVLQNPKQRGVLGEYWLETLLSNVLPPDNYKMQYHLGVDEEQNALIADAVIFVRDQVIPVDAKFSLENYNRMVQEETKEGRERYEKELKADVKRRIDETAKYIRPESHTMDFAFMFIPAEGVYYNLLNAEVGSGINSVNLIEYAFQKHVLIVSPTSFFAYLQTVLLGLRELQIEKSAQEILKRVAMLGKHFHHYTDLHSKLGKNISTVVNQYNQSSNELQKMDKDVQKITSGQVEDVLELENVQAPLIE